VKRWLYRGSEQFLLSAWSSRFKRAGGSGSAPPREAKEEPPLENSAAPVDVSTWIKIQVLDDETGNPVEGVPLRLNIAGRSVETHTTDQRGRINVSGLQPGTFHIEGMDDEEAYEVVQVS
jgi:hypothetical protein